MTPADIPAGLALCRASRWNQLAEDWQCFLESPHGRGWIAEQDGAAVGTVAILRYGPSFTWLSMMLVDPGARRAGIGTRLMETAMAALAGEPCVRLDATPAGEPLYRRFGFTAEYELVRAKSSAVGAAAHNHAHPMQPADFDSILAYDRQVFGADRGALLHTFYQRAPEMAWTLPRAGTLAGYCFGRPGHLYRQVGPVVADDEAGARQLIDACRTREDLAIDVSRAAAGWLEQAGFTIERPFLRMHRGEPVTRGIPSCQFAIAGPEFG
jgi:GNAT superfamily N-acetyltransferase